MTLMLLFTDNNWWCGDVASDVLAKDIALLNSSIIITFFFLVFCFGYSFTLILLLYNFL